MRKRWWGLSGPKGVSYRVVSAEELRHRALDQSRSRCGELETRLDALSAEERRSGLSVPAAGGSRPGRRTSDDLDAWQSYESELRAQIEVRHARLADVRQRACQALIHRELGIDGSIQLGVRHVPTVRQRSAAQQEVDGSLERAAAVIARLEDSSVQEALVARMRRISEHGEDLVAARPLLAVLRAEIQRELRTQESSRRLRQRISDLDVQLAGIPGVEAQEMRRFLAGATTAAAVESAEQRAAEVRARAQAEQDRVFVVAQASAAFRHLGYDVGEEFVTAAMAGAPGLVEPPDLPGHRLQIVFLPGSARFLTNVVGLADQPDAAADLDAETATCRDLTAVESSLTAQGIETTRFHDVPPGQVPVERATAVQRAQERVRASRRRSRTRAGGRTIENP